MGKQFHRLDVGVTIYHPSGHDGTGIRLFGGNPLQARYEVHLNADIKRQPDQHRQHQPPVGQSNDHKCRGEVHQDVHHHIEQLHDGFAHRQGGLHHFGGDPAGKVVLIERHALLQQITVCLPADFHGVIAQQRLMNQGRVQKHHHRQNHHQGYSHQAQPQTFFLQERIGVFLHQPIDQLPHKTEQQDFQDRQCGREQRHAQQGQFQSARVMAAERIQALRRLLRVLGREGIYEAFEESEHSGTGRAKSGRYLSPVRQRL